MKHSSQVDAYQSNRLPFCSNLPYFIIILQIYKTIPKQYKSNNLLHLTFHSLNPTLNNIYKTPTSHFHFEYIFPHIQNRKPNHFIFIITTTSTNFILITSPSSLHRIITSPSIRYLHSSTNFFIIISQIEKMEIIPNAFNKIDCNQKTLDDVSLCFNQGQDDLIQMYLNREVFYQQELQRIQHFCCQTEEKQESKMQNPQVKSEETIVSTKEGKRGKKSIFHNFQKHLISTIKKYITFNKNSGDSKEEGIAFELWQAFAKTNSYNKRLLHTVFGADTDNAREDFAHKLAQEFSEFKKIYTKYGFEKVLAAQEIIRQRVVEQSNAISKSMIKANSSILKFQEFFEYYIHFISEISSGPMPKRMKKQSKLSVLLTLNQSHPK